MPSMPNMSIGIIIPSIELQVVVVVVVPGHAGGKALVVGTIRLVATESVAAWLSFSTSETVRLALLSLKRSAP